MALNTCSTESLYLPMKRPAKEHRRQFFDPVVLGESSLLAMVNQFHFFGQMSHDAKLFLKRWERDIDAIGISMSPSMWCFDPEPVDVH